MSRLTPQLLGGLLLLWNIGYGIFWIGLSESGPVYEASARYGHVEDYDERMKLMEPVMTAGWKEVRAYYPLVLTLVGVNCILAILLLRRLGQQAITRPNV